MHTQFSFRSVLERVLGQFLGITGGVADVLEDEETPLLTAHQPVSWSSPGPTSCRCTGFQDGEIGDWSSLLVY